MASEEFTCINLDLKKRKKEIRISLGQVRVFSHELNEVVGSYTHITRKQPIIINLLIESTGSL